MDGARREGGRPLTIGVSLVPQGSLAGVLAGRMLEVKDAADRATHDTALRTKQQFRLAVAQALGQRASQTIGLTEYLDPAKPIAALLYSRWWRGRQDVLSGFVTGSIITPREAGALAIPMTDEARGAGIPFAQGQLPTFMNVPGGMIAGINQSGRRRMTPGIFEGLTGLRLEEIHVRGRAFLVAHVRRPGQGVVVDNRLGGRKVRGRFGLNLQSLSAQKGAATFTFFAFMLARRVRQPALIQRQPVVEFAERTLAIEFAIELVRKGVTPEGVIEFGPA